MAKNDTDWEGVEREYRAGQLSLSEIGAMFGLSKGRISQVAKRDGWTQDLGARIKAQAISKLNEKLINAELNAESRLASDNDRVAAGAEALARVVLGHQTSVAKLRARVVAYNEELDNCPDSLAERTKILKALSDTEKVLIALERQAYGIGDAQEADTPNQPQLAPNDAARRVAFLLLQGSQP